jgi:cobalt-zinc-cadmium efflux system outer membrane protein
MHRPWILACAILAGCTAYQPKPIDPTQLAQRFEERSLSSDSLHRYLAQQLGHPVAPWPLPSWNRPMLTLAAGYYSPALGIAGAQWDTARTGNEVAGARPNPFLQFPFEYITNHAGSGRPYTTGPSFDIPVETAHKRGYRVDQATYLSEAARQNLSNEAWKLRSQIREALLNIFAWTKRTAFLAAKVEQQAQILDMLRRRENVGDAAGPDVRRARILSGQAQAELAAARQAQLDGRARLARTVGLPLSALDGAQLDLKEFEHAGAVPPPAEARRATIFQRADLLAALAQYEASQAALQLEIAKQYPDVHIGLGYTYDAGANKISLGLVSVALPLLDRNQGAIAQAQARRAEAAARTAALQDGIIIDLEHALVRYRESLDTLRLATATVAAAQRQMNSQAALFAAGATDRLARTQAQLDYQASAIDHLNSLVTAQQAAGLLEDAMQRPLPTSPIPMLTPEPESLK